MSNSSAGSVLNTFSGTYFQWLENDVLPYVSGCMAILILVSGTVLNSVLLHAFTKTWLLSQPICILSGIFVSSCFYATFIFMTLMGVERLVKIWNSKLYESTFGRRCHCIVMSVAVWLYCCALSAIPLAGWDQIEYVSYQQRCSLSYKTNSALLHTTIVLGFCIPFCILCGSFIFILVKRQKLRRDLTKIERIDLNTKNEPTLQNQQFCKEDVNFGKDKQRIVKRSTETGTRNISTIIVTEHEDKSSNLSCVKQNNASFIESMTSDNIASETGNSDEQVFDANVADERSTDKNKNKNVISVYDGSKEQIDFRLALTYFTMWIVLVILWIPYIILTYLRVYNTVSIWNGWMTLTVVLGNVSYCIKPIIFITHNNIFKTFAMDSVPESVKKRASKARKIIRNTAKKVDSFVFLQIKEPTFFIKDKENEDKII